MHVCMRAAPRVSVAQAGELGLTRCKLGLARYELRLARCELGLTRCELRLMLVANWWGWASGSHQR